MSAFASGFGGYLAILLIAVLAHEPWRWAGLYLGRTVDADSEVFRWVRAVATALVAALVTRLVLFPAGALESVSLVIRLASFAAGFAIFFATGRHLAAGIFGGAAVLATAKLVLG